MSLKRVVHARVGARWMVDDHQGKEALCIALEAAMFSFLQTNTPVRTYNRGGDVTLTRTRSVVFRHRPSQTCIDVYLARSSYPEISMDKLCSFRDFKLRSGPRHCVAHRCQWWRCSYWRPQHIQVVASSRVKDSKGALTMKHNKSDKVVWRPPCHKSPAL